MQYMREPSEDGSRAFCVSPSMLGISRPLRIDQIVHRLQGWPLRAVVAALDEMFRLQLYAQSAEDQQVIARRYLDPPACARFDQAIAENPQLSVIAPHALMVTLVHALAYCPVAVPEPSRLERRLGMLVLSMGEQTDGTDTIDVPLVMARHTAALQVTALQGHAADAWVALTHALLFDVLPSLTAHSDFVDVRALLEAEFSCSLEEFWAILAIHAQGSLYVSEDGTQWATDALDFSDLGEPEGPDAELIRRVTSSFEIPLAEARKRARSDLEVPGFWGFWSLIDRPAVRLPDGSRLMVWRAGLARMTEPGSIRDRVARLLRGQGKDTHGLTAFWGAAVETLGRNLLNDVSLKEEIFREESDLRSLWGAGKCCDFGLRAGGAVVLGDFVQRPLTMKALALGDRHDLRRDYQRTIWDKFGQVDATAERALAADPSIETIYPVVVVGAAFPINEVLRMILEVGGNMGEFAALGDDRCRPPILLDLADFAMLLQAAQATGQSLGELLDAWSLSEEWGRPLKEWIDDLDVLDPDQDRPWFNSAQAIMNAMH